jgi:dCTP deaminase
MVMVDWEIKQAIQSGEIKITPFDAALINPCSLDIRLGSTFGRLEATDRRGMLYVHPDRVNQTISHYVIDPCNKDSFRFEYLESDEYHLLPGQFVLASMFEKVELSEIICATLMGKSSLGRLGLANSNYAAGWVDSNWAGVLVMELFNSGPCSLKLQKGMKIGQLILHRTEAPDKDYSETGRYQNQSLGGSLGV